MLGADHPAWTIGTDASQRVETSGLWQLRAVAKEIKSQQAPRRAASPVSVQFTDLSQMATLGVTESRWSWRAAALATAALCITLAATLAIVWFTDRQAPQAGQRPELPLLAGYSSGSVIGPTRSPTPQPPIPGPVKGATAAPVTLDDVTNQARSTQPDGKRRARDRRARDKKVEPTEARKLKNYSLSKVLATVAKPSRSQPAAPAEKPLAGPKDLKSALANSARKAPSPPVEKAAEASRTDTMVAMLRKASLEANVKAHRAKKATPADRPAKLSTSAIRKGMTRALGPARHCLRRFGFAYQTLRIRITVAGATGKVKSARILGRFAETPVGRCVQQGMKRLAFGRFTQATQSFTFPVVVR